jgi:hypothetical protein
MLVTGMLAAASLAAWNVSAAPSPAPGSSDSSKDAKVRLAWNQHKLPLSFEANHGQVDSSVQYLARGAGFGIYFTGQEAVLALHKPASRLAAVSGHSRLEVRGVGLTTSGPASPQEARKVAPTAMTTDVIRMQLAGANSHTRPTGLDPLPGTSNYILGKDPSKWHTAIPNYSRVKYAGVYDGVDLMYYGNQSQLEYDFIVAPHADPASIRLRFAGASRLSLDPDGNLAIHAPDGSVSFQKPVLYQETRGGRRPVAGSFKLLDRDTISFAIGAYDRGRPLVIDPILAYSTFFGGSNAEFAVAVTADAAGNAYVCGLTISTDFPLTAGAFQSVNYAEAQNAVSTAFVSKFDASGSALLYSTYLGGNAIADALHEQGDYAHGIAVDAGGNAYVTGWTYSSDFPITSGAFQTTDQAANIAQATGFVTKLSPSGTGLVYSTYLGGDVLDEPNSIAIDATGNAYVSGITFSGNFPVSSAAFQKINNSAGTNGFNAFVTKLNPAGSELVYSTYLGGANSGGTTIGNIYWTNPIAIDKSGDAYVAGFTASGDYPVTSSAFQKVSHATGFAVTVTKLNPTGSALIYSTYLSGSTTSISEGLAVDSSGDAYVAGYTSDQDFPVTTGAFQTTNKADTNTSISSDTVNSGFITKLNPTGSALVYSTYLGGTTGPWGGDHIYALALDSTGHAYVTGGAMSADFPVTANAYQPTNRGATHCCDYLTYTSNGFLAEMNFAGNGLLYSTYIGGSGTQNPNGPGGYGDEAYYLALGPNSNAYVVGYTTSPNFPVTAGAFETKYHTDQNTGFVADFDLGAAPAAKDTYTTLTASANPVVPGTSVTFTAVVAPISGSGIPAGNVIFSIDEAPVATVALGSAGKAAYTAASLPAGAHYVLASYSGSTTYASSGDGFNEFIVPAQPVIAPAAGTYYDQQTVTVTAPTAGSVLYYTLDGTVPTVFSSTYTAPLIVNKDTTLNVVAVSEHDATSSTSTAAYTIIGSPSALIGPATLIATPTSTLNAFVNDLGAAGTWYFKYGTSASSLTTSTATTSLAASTTRVEVSRTLSALATKTTYYYQVVITTAGGSTTSGVASFTTN